MPLEDIRKQMEAAARELWGKQRASQLGEQIEPTATALARLEAIPLGSGDDFDYLEGR